jgi:hypothetical protein
LIFLLCSLGSIETDIEHMAAINATLHICIAAQDCNQLTMILIHEYVKVMMGRFSVE